MLLIQEVTHWETSTEQVAIPDQALEFQQGVDAGGVERITSAPSLSSQSPCVFFSGFFVFLLFLRQSKLASVKSLKLRNGEFAPLQSVCDSPRPLCSHACILLLCNLFHS